MTLLPFSARSTVIIIAIMLLVPQSNIGQNRKRKADFSSWEIGFSGGVSKFLTSINPSSDALYKKFNYWNADFNAATTLSVIKDFSPKFSAEFEWLSTKLSGSWNQNSGYPVPPLAIAKGLPYPDPFKTGISQFDLVVVVNLNQLIIPNVANDKWYLFAKAGGGLTTLKEFSGLYPYGAGNGLKYAILYGGGLSYKIDDKIKLKLGITWSRVASDRLDGIQTLTPDNLHPVFKVTESYFYPYVGLTYVLVETKSTIRHFTGNSKKFWFRPSKWNHKTR